MSEGRILCNSCGETLSPKDDVRQVYRELTDADAVAVPDARWAYTHIGHEPGGTGYRITGRGRLAQLEEKRLRAPQSPDLNAPGTAAPALLERMRQMRSSAGKEPPPDDHRVARPKISAAPLPQSVEELANLLDVSFFATLLAEEGRPTRFVVSFIGPDEHGVSARRLASPVPFTPESVRRLAPAADPELSSLAVSRTDDGLAIWGLLDVPRLFGLQIFGAYTGQLRVRYLGQTQMVHAQGRGLVRREADPNFTTSTHLVAAAMGLVTPQSYRPRALLGLADALVEAAHGGAILVSRRPAEEVRRHRIGLTYPSLGPLRTLDEPVLEAQGAAPAAAPDSELLAHFKSLERQRDIYRSARLGAVDGAVLVDPRLRITGFGAMIDVKGHERSGASLRGRPLGRNATPVGSSGGSFAGFGPHGSPGGTGWRPAASIGDTVVLDIQSRAPGPRVLPGRRCKSHRANRPQR
jgi:hypothetical protein